MLLFETKYKVSQILFLFIQSNHFEVLLYYRSSNFFFEAAYDFLLSLYLCSPTFTESIPSLRACNTCPISIAHSDSSKAVPSQPFQSRLFLHSCVEGWTFRKMIGLFLKVHFQGRSESIIL